MNTSAHAHAKIKSIDTTLAESYAGVKGVYTAKDIPGKNLWGMKK
jgi:xanthine dehydrogenase molybdopterin-binding subunit B